MKHIISTFLVFACIYSASAQVSVSTFQSEITALSNAIDQKSLKIQDYEIDRIDKLMTQQIEYNKVHGGAGSSERLSTEQKVYATLQPMLTKNRIIADEAGVVNQLKLFAATCR